MPNKVISMCDRFYFHNGRMFIQTRKNVNAEFIVYSPNLTKEQKSALKKNDIECKSISSYIFNHCMQALKFNLMADEINLNENSKYGITYVDFDTFFPNDWQSKVFSKPFDLGITIRKNSIKKKDYKCYANGGVIFSRNARRSYILCKSIDSIIFFGNAEKLSEYDVIWKTLEDPSRPKHKIHYRENHRWWGDQVALSSFVLRSINKNGKLNPSLDWEGYKFRFFDCNKFNKLNSKPQLVDNDDVYIRHLKKVGRGE